MVISPAWRVSWVHFVVGGTEAARGHRLPAVRLGTQARALAGATAAALLEQVVKGAVTWAAVVAVATTEVRPVITLAEEEVLPTLLSQDLRPGPVKTHGMVTQLFPSFMTPPRSPRVHH